MIKEIDHTRLGSLWERVAAAHGTDASSVLKEIDSALAAVWASPAPVPGHAVTEEPSVLRTLHEEAPDADALLCYLVHWMLSEENGFSEEGTERHITRSDTDL